jgi:hypothetical protein
LALLCGVLLAAGDVVLRDIVEHVSDSASGGDGVDGDLLLAAVDGQDLDKGLNSALRSRVERVAGHSKRVSSVGAHENDSATLVQVLVTLSRNEKLATGVDGEDTVELLLHTGREENG